MSTKYELKCRERRCACAGKKRLFDILLALARNDKSMICPGHGYRYRLELEFPFALSVSHNKFTVLDCFTPRKPELWRHKKHRVEYYPFLVVLERKGRGTSFWLPYWHIDGDKRKYGQWAPIMDAKLFIELLSQARRKGYCKSRDCLDSMPVAKRK